MTAASHERSDLALRPACGANRDLLLLWTTELRACGFALSGSEPIESTEHSAWFAAALSDPNCRIWLMEHVGAPVGMVRLEREAVNARDVVVVSVFVVREARRLGLASVAIERALRDVALDRGALTAIARVRLGNVVSLRFFESLGFVTAERHVDHVVLHRRLPG